ncbi:hypothetical protein [Geminocystis herdmanii]|uniref:hypothetical protein n=1 Tax=Geminocystis herdmanii TaxID=669359 RepID=UPI0003615849|nr:hypothetical protein [Geminocystis herdmanii]
MSKFYITEVFLQFISNNVSNHFLGSIVKVVNLAHIDILLMSVESLDDPSAYCKHDDDRKTVKGFFLYLDFISALIINLGERSIDLLNKYKNSQHPFIP